MGKILSHLTTVVIVACALVVTGLTIRRELVPSPAEEGVPQRIDGWEEVSAVGHRRGPDDAPVTIVEFGDFQCPVCRAFALRSLEPILEKYPRQVSHVYRHWPLDYHPFAKPSAVAAECAGLQGRFFEFHNAILEKQDSLGLRTFAEFAIEAGVPDLSSFSACIENPAVFDRTIRDDIEAAQKTGGEGTPTIIINGLRLPGAPTAEKLEEYIQEALNQIA